MRIATFHKLFFCIAILLLSMSTFTEAQDGFRSTTLSADLKGGLGAVLRSEPSEGIDGGPAAKLHVVPFDLGFFNLGIDTGIINTTSSGTESEKTATYDFRITVSATKYLAKDDWLAFPYAMATIGLWTRFALFSDEFTTSLVPFPRESADADPIGQSDSELTFWDNFRFGPGISLEAGFLVPLRGPVYLILS